MATHRAFGKITGPLSHLPTWFFIIGYPLFWMDLAFHNAGNGVTSNVPWILWGCVAVLCLLEVLALKKNLSLKSFWSRLDLVEKFFWGASFGIAMIILGIILVAGLKPIHLTQEFDCIQYHYALPRQHLILGSFAHIPWAADDLFLLPIDFSLSPFWFATVLPNKIPQLIIFFGLIFVAIRLTSALAGSTRPWAGPMIALIILGTHGFEIQTGTAMLDLAIIYLFIASLDSLRLGNWFLAGIEFTFFFWSKPLMPIAVTITLGIWAFFYFLASKNRWQIMDILVLKYWENACWVFLILSVIVAGPFIVKSIYYAATPLFPWAPGMMGTQAQIQTNPSSWHSLLQASQYWMDGTRNGYGHGQGIGPFIKHWWLLAVPEGGVNNAFDYPLGLTYLLMIVPFMFFLIKDISQRKFSPLSILVMINWGLWWFTAQQSRFLFLPLMVVFIVSVSRMDRISRGLLIGVLISLSFEMISLWGAHKGDMTRWGVNVLRSKDKQLVELNHHYHGNPMKDYVDWPTHDVAYAQFPVMVHKENLPHTILF